MWSIINFFFECRLILVNLRNRYIKEDIFIIMNVCINVYKDNIFNFYV